MSFVYLPEAEAGFSPPSTSWDSARSATSTTTTTASGCCKPESETDCSTTPRSGMTSEHSTGDPGVDAWILSLRDSRASHSPAPASDEAQSINETSGPTPFASLKRCGQRGFYWKTHPSYDALDGKRITPRRRKPITSGRYLATWPAAGSMRSGVCYPREPLERTTAAGGSGLLPTPLARDYRSGKGKQKRQGSPALSEVLMSEAGGGSGLLNPDFVEWMMGWPIGWTESKPLDAAKFRWWLRQHGRS